MLQSRATSFRNSSNTQDFEKFSKRSISRQSQTPSGRESFSGNSNRSRSNSTTPKPSSRKGKAHTKFAPLDSLEGTDSPLEPSVPSCQDELDDGPAYIKEKVLPPVLAALADLLFLIKTGTIVPDPLKFLARTLKPGITEKEKDLESSTNTLGPPSTKPTTPANPTTMTTSTSGIPFTPEPDSSIASPENAETANVKQFATVQEEQEAVLLNENSLFILPEDSHITGIPNEYLNGISEKEMKVFKDVKGNFY